MATTKDERILKQVRNEVVELRKLGEEWGMTTGQVNSCINEAFSQKLTIEITKIIANKMQAETKWSKIRFVFRLWLAFVILLSGFTLMLTQTDYFASTFNRVMQPYGYPLMRAVRLVAVPLHRFNISSYHNSECIISNPYFEDEEEDCFPCEGVQKVRITKLTKDKELGPQFFTKPILFTGLQKKAVTLVDVVNLVKAESDVLSDPTLIVTSSVDWVKSVHDLKIDDLLEKINQNKNFHVEWWSRRISTGQLFRNLFPRPCVIPKKSEVVIDKTLFIAGPKSDGVSMDFGLKASDMFYIQGSGTRTILFMAKPGCTDVCSDFEVTLSTGDVLAFPNAWNVELLPNEEGISISFVGGFA